jgi:putative membrane protein
MSLKHIVETPLRIKKMNLLRFGRDFKPDEEVILRDYLAIERTRLANERTLLSYIRSSLYLLLGGIAFFQLDIFPNFEYLAFASLFFSAIFFVIGIYRFTLLKKSLKRLYYTFESNNKSANESTEES